MDAGKGILDRRAKRFNIGGVAAAKNEAKNGYWAKSPKPKPKSNEKENVFKVGYDHHIKREKSKGDWRNFQIENGRKQLEVMQDIGVSINCMGMTDKDYYADFKEYVMTEYEPKENRVEIIKTSKDEKDAFIDLWRVVIRRRYPKVKKDESIKRMFDFLKSSNQ